MDFGQSPISLRIALFIALLALILQIVGVATPYWININTEIYKQVLKEHNGIWEACVGDVCTKFDAVGWLKAVRGLEVIGILLIFVSLIATVLSIFMNADSSNLRKLKTIAALASFIAGIFIIVGVIIYGAKIDENGKGTISLKDHLSWSFGLCIVAGILSVMDGVSILVSFRG